MQGIPWDRLQVWVCGSSCARAARLACVRRQRGCCWHMPAWLAHSCATRRGRP
jgi:hypothetical protein